MKLLNSLITAFLGLALVASHSKAEEEPDLTGLVKTRDGAPISKAMVFIYSAGQKHGSSVLCPYCYPDCNKKSQTDENGQFEIQSLNPELIFKILVVANGYESQIVSGIDPAKGPKGITMAALTEETLNSPTRMNGVMPGTWRL